MGMIDGIKDKTSGWLNAPFKWVDKGKTPLKRKCVWLLFALE